MNYKDIQNMQELGLWGMIKIHTLFYQFSLREIYSDDDLLTIEDLKEDEKYYMLFSDSDFEAFFEN